jgi:hypothetical protein
MPTVAEVIRFMNGVGDSKLLITEGTKGLAKINSYINALESAMMEEFGCSKEELCNLPKDKLLGPKATEALALAIQESFADPLSAMKATALTWRDKIEEWKVIARKNGATHIVVGNDSFDYEDFPIYASSLSEVMRGINRLNNEAGVYYVTTIVVD